MADNVTLPATGSGDATPVVATDQDASAPNAHYQLIKPAWGPLNTFNLADTASGKPLPVQLRGSDGTDRSNKLPISAAAGDAQVFGAQVTVSTDITRPADTTAYAANDAFADSTSAPTTGGFTFTNAARASGGSGVITDLVVVSSADPATTLQGEIWIYDQAVTAVNDNAAFASGDADTKNLVAVIPFTLSSTVAGSGTTSYADVQNVNKGFTCVGTANLRYLVKVKAAYTPISAEVLTVRLKIVQTN